MPSRATRTETQSDARANTAADRGYDRSRAEARTLLAPYPSNRTADWRSVERAPSPAAETSATGWKWVPVEAEKGDERAVRAARNQALYREINERVEAINAAFDSVLPLGDWICECADNTCMERLSLTHEEYETLRASGRRFAVRPHDDHVVAEVEDIVERNERYWVVEKKGVAAEIAEEVDPRRLGSPG